MTAIPGDGRFIRPNATTRAPQRDLNCFFVLPATTLQARLTLQDGRRIDAPRETGPQAGAPARRCHGRPVAASHATHGLHVHGHDAAALDQAESENSDSVVHVSDTMYAGQQKVREQGGGGLLGRRAKVVGGSAQPRISCGGRLAVRPTTRRAPCNQGCGGAMLQPRWGSSVSMQCTSIQLPPSCMALARRGGARLLSGPPAAGWGRGAARRGATLLAQPGSALLLQEALPAPVVQV